MSHILVSGLINIETTLFVDRFPIPYFPVRYPFDGVQSSVSGVGYNIARALTVLGDDVRFISLIGRDMYEPIIRTTLREEGIASDCVLSALEATAQSVILYDSAGRRQIHVDLKDIQDQTYPQEPFDAALLGCDLAVLCNINWSRPYLEPTKARGIPIVTDVHALSDLDDAYNRDFMAAADILFMSDDQLPASPEQWVREVLKRYPASVVILGMGARGALLAERGRDTATYVPAVYTRSVVNTIGAGDALLSAFVHAYIRSGNPGQALRKAMVFASYKIGERGAAAGFLSADELDRWCEVLYGPADG